MALKRFIRGWILELCAKKGENSGCQHFLVKPLRLEGPENLGLFAKGLNLDGVIFSVFLVKSLRHANDFSRNSIGNYQNH